MTSFSPTSLSKPRCVGVLYERHLSDDRGRQCTSWKVYAGEQLFIGRNPAKCQYVVCDPGVSSKHVRVYTILVDQEETSDIAPLVYAEDLSRNGTYWNGSLMGKGRGGFLLSDGDVLQICRHTQLVFRSCIRDEPDAAFDELQEQEMDHFRDRYVVTDRKLGAGAFGQVYMAVEQASRSQIACKIIDLRKFAPRPKVKFGPPAAPLPASNVSSPEQMEKMYAWGESIKVETARDREVKKHLREANILAKVKHPNIIGIQKVFKSNDTIYIFQDLVTGGDLFSYLEAKGGILHEIDVVVIMRQILVAVNHLHENGVAHRDLKPENILMTSVSNGCRIILTDFGGATTFSVKQDRMTSAIGTAEYTAPEVIHRSDGYTQAVDMWSIGCITVVLLTGGSPFRDPLTNQYSQVMAHQCNLTDLEHHVEWQAVTERPKDFVKKLLRLAERERLTARQALSHQWFTHKIYQDEFLKLYHRSTRHWRPTHVRPPLIEDLNIAGVKSKHAQSPGSEVKPLKKRNPRPVDPPYKPYPRRMNSILSSRGDRHPLCTRLDVIDAVERTWGSRISKRPTPSRSCQRHRSHESTLPLPSHNIIATSTTKQSTSFSVNDRRENSRSKGLPCKGNPSAITDPALENHTKRSVARCSSLQRRPPSMPDSRTSAETVPRTPSPPSQSRDPQTGCRRRPFSPNAWTDEPPRQSSGVISYQHVKDPFSHQRELIQPKYPEIPEPQRSSAAPCAANTSRSRIPSSERKRKKPHFPAGGSQIPHKKRAPAQSQKRSIFDGHVEKMNL